MYITQHALQWAGEKMRMRTTCFHRVTHDIARLPNDIGNAHPKVRPHFGRTGIIGLPPHLSLIHI